MSFVTYTKSNIYRLIFSPEQKNKVMMSIEQLKFVNVDKDYISLTLAAACLDISSATSQSTLLVV